MSAETVIRGANLLEGEKAVRRKAELRVQRDRSVEDTQEQKIQQERQAKA